MNDILSWYDDCNMSIKEVICHHNIDYHTKPTVLLYKAKYLTMLRLIVLALIFASAANASRIKIIGGKDVETPGTSKSNDLIYCSFCDDIHCFVILRLISPLLKKKV